MNIGEFSEKLGISAHTLRYYEKIGLIQGVRRSGGKRAYSEHDLRWLEFIQRLKATGMPLSQIKLYSDLRYEGDSTITERKEMLRAHKELIEQEAAKLQEHLKILGKKIIIYEEMEKKNEQVRRRFKKT